MNVYVEVKTTGEWRWCHESNGKVTPYSSGVSALPVLELAERTLRFALMDADVGCTLHIEPNGAVDRAITLCKLDPDQHPNLAQLMDEKQVEGYYLVFIGYILDRLAPS